MLRSMLLALALAFGLTTAASAAGEADIPAPASAIATQFFTMLQDEKYPEAFHYAFKDLEPIMGASNVSAAAIGIQDLTKGMGSIVKWSVLQVKPYNSDFIEVTYCVEYEAIPMFYTVQFYNPGKGWRMVDVKANTFNKARDDKLIN